MNEPYPLDVTPDLETPAEPDIPDYQSEPVDTSEVTAIIMDDTGDRIGDYLGIVVGDTVVIVTGTAEDGMTEMYIDEDGDGRGEVRITEQSDGTYRLERLAAAGEVAETVVVTREELLSRLPGAVELLDLPDPSQLPVGPVEVPFGPPEHTDSAADPVGDPAVEPVPPSGTEWSVVDGQLIGDPADKAEHWFEQSANGFCAPAAVAQIVSDYTGQHFGNEDAFRELANQYGLFVVGPDGVPGLTLEGTTQLLVASGVPAQMGYGDMSSLADALGQGRGVIAFVDSGELWTGEPAEDDAPDHVVVVTGIDLERGTVILSDPGSPGGRNAEVPIALFDNAWADGDHAMVVCDQPAPSDDEATSGPAVEAAGPAPAPGTGTGTGTGTGLQASAAQVSAVLDTAAGWVLLPKLGGLTASPSALS